MRTHRFVALATVGALLILTFSAGVACAISKGQLKSEALSISNFPTGWSVNNSADTGDQGCVSALRNPGKNVTKVTARFSDGNAPDVEEVLMAGTGAQHTYAKLSQTLSKCKSYTVTSGGQTATMHVGAMSFPQVGQGSTAYAFTVTVQGVNLGADVVLFRAGRTFGAIEYEDFGSPNTDQAEAYVTEAVNKVEGKPTVTPTTF